MSTDGESRSFGMRLQRHRKAAGLSQEELAERAGLSRRGISDLERGVRRAPYRDTVMRLAEALELAEAELDLLLAASHRPIAIDAPAPVIPSPLTSFVGREDAVAELTPLLRTSRLMTLTGPGGIGKTRLALAVAGLAGAGYRDGMCVVELAALTDPLMVPRAVADVLGVREEVRRPVLETLIGVLRAKQLLLVLDNCEHLAAACAGLVETVSGNCPEVRILATSREPLGSAGEQLWSVPPLALPQAGRVSASDIAQAASVQLFVERARAGSARFSLTEANAPAVADVCRQLDGIPLALELAAARIRLLTAEQIADRLEDRFGLLSNGARTAVPRHQTLRAAIDWSYNLLSRSEQVLLSRLSVFAGGWNLEAAEVVCGGASAGPDGVAAVLDVLGQLVDRSLVIAEPTRAGAMRYRLLETLRQYAAERLAEADDASAIRDRHLDWFVGVAEEGDRDIWRAEQIAALERLEEERDNLRAALTWSLIRASPDPAPGLRIAAALVRFWDLRSYLSEGSEWLTSLLALPGAARPTPWRARALTALGCVAVCKGEGKQARAALEEGLTFWRAFGDPRGLAVSMFFLASLADWVDGDVHAAESFYLQALTLSRQRGPRWTTYMSIGDLGEAARVKGEYDRAEALLAEGRALAEQAGDRWGTSVILMSLGLTRLCRGDVQTARAHLDQALELTLELGYSRGTSYALECLACVAAAEGNAAQAARFFGAAPALKGVGDVIMASLRVEREKATAAARTQLGDAAFEAAEAEGRALSLEAVVAEARRGVPARNMLPSKRYRSS